MMYSIIELEGGKFQCICYIQDGVENWIETSRDEAIQSLVRAAKTLNGSSITEVDIHFRKSAVGMIDLKNKLEHIKIKSNSFLVVKVGSDNRPATVGDIELIQDIMDKALGKKFPDLPVIVSHHDIDVKLYTCK